VIYRALAANSPKDIVFCCQLVMMANPSPQQQTSRTSTSTTLGATSITQLPSDHPLKVAVDKFTKDNSKANLAQFTNTTYDELRNAINQIQSKQHARRELRNFARIQSFLEAMEQFGKVIEVFLNVADPLAFVWGPMKFLLQVLTLEVRTQRVD
jgi:hypothetical protein